MGLFKWLAGKEKDEEEKLLIDLKEALSLIKKYDRSYGLRSAHSSFYGNVFGQWGGERAGTKELKKALAWLREVEKRAEELQGKYTLSTYRRNVQLTPNKLALLNFYTDLRKKYRKDLFFPLVHQVNTNGFRKSEREVIIKKLDNLIKIYVELLTQK